MRLLPTPAGLLLAWSIIGCGSPPEAVTHVDPVTATILAPADADTVSLPFTIQLDASGIVIAPATGVREDGVGHHHLLVDHDLPPGGQPVVAGPGYVHLGSGVSTWVLDSVPPGTYRVIAAIAWGDHVPVAGARTDTVHIVVR